MADDSHNTKPLTIHNRAVEELMARYDGPRTTGFEAKIAKIFARIPAEERPRPGVRPDGYLVHEADKVIIAFEVEDHHRLTADKMQRYIALHWAINYFWWDLGVAVFDRWGNQTTLISPMEWDIQNLVRKTKRQKRFGIAAPPGWTDDATTGDEP